MAVAAATNVVGSGCLWRLSAGTYGYQGWLLLTRWETPNQRLLPLMGRKLSPKVTDGRGICKAWGVCARMLVCIVDAERNDWSGW